jgi:cytidylate kinase
LGYRVVSRELLYETVQRRHQITGETLSTLLADAPRFRAPDMAQREGRVSVAEQRRHLFAAVQDSLCELVRDDDVAYHGYAGHQLLLGVSHVLRVRLVAPRARRIELAMQRLGINKTDASRHIDQVDNERVRWTQNVFGVRWDDPLLFDLVLNLDAMSLDEIADIVSYVARLPRFQATAESRQRLADVHLGASVAARLLSDATLGRLPVQVSAEGGNVRIVGVTGESQAKLAEEMARALEGVVSVQLGA